MTRANASVISSLVAGVGPARLTAPLSFESIRWRNAAASSWMLIHGQYWVPRPNPAPRPKRREQPDRLRPPPFATTTADREFTTRVAPAAIAAAASQACTRSGKKPSPDPTPR